MKLSDYVWSFLRAQGVGHVFLFPGGQAMHLLDSLGTSGIPYTCALHEQAAAFAAVAYAEYTGSLGVCLTTNGPGATNALTGCACAWLESAPVLFLSGQVKRADLMGTSGLRSRGPQELDIISMVRGITKYAAQVGEPTLIRRGIEFSTAFALAPRQGPCWLDIPLDVQAAEIDPYELRCAHDPREPAKPSMESMVELLAGSHRPAVLVGNGARTPRLREFLDRLSIPILTTWKGLDLVPHSHPNLVGSPGRIGHPGANRVVENCDLLLSLGARLDLLTTNFSPETFAPRARKIVVDIDSAEVGKLLNVDLRIVATAEDFISEFLARDSSHEVPCRWTSQARAWKSRRRFSAPFSAFVEVLSQVLQPDDVIVLGGSGQGVETVLDGFRVTAGQRVLAWPTLGAMGTGLPAAIGAALASKRRVVCVLGDGGFQLNIQELETVRRLGLPIHYLVLTDGRFASIEAMQRRHFDGRLVASGPESGVSLPDIPRIALAYGLDAQTISYPYRSALDAVLSLPGPSVSAILPRNS